MYVSNSTLSCRVSFQFRSWKGNYIHFMGRSPSIIQMRSIITRSRFRPISVKDHVHSKLSESLTNLSSVEVEVGSLKHNHEPQIDGIHAPIADDTTLQQYEQLQRGLIEKMKELHIDAEDNSDVSLIFYKRRTKSKIADIDNHILNMSKVLTDSSNHDSRSLFEQYLNPAYEFKTKRNQNYIHKYDLINEKNAIAEMQYLNDFIDRLTRYNYLNYNSKIQSFLKNRLIYDKVILLSLNNNASLCHSLINYFSCNLNYENVRIISKIFNNLNAFDIRILNILLKNLLKNSDNPIHILMFLNSMVEIFQSLNLSINKTTIYLIYKFINIPKSETYNYSIIKDYLHNLIKEYKFNDSKEFTSIVFNEVSTNLQLIHQNKSNKDFITMLKLDSKLAIRLLPKYKEISNKSKFTVKSIREAHQLAKFKTQMSYIDIINSTLIANNWKRAFNIAISPQIIFDNMHFLNKDKRFLPDQISEFQKENKDLKHSNFGAIFKFNKSNYEKVFHNTLLLSLSKKLLDDSNWQLFIRLLNSSSASKLDWNVFAFAFSKLTIEKPDQLNKQSYLIVVKYLLNLSLKTDLGPFKYWSPIFTDLQFQMDKLFQTDFSNIDYGKNYHHFEQLLGPDTKRNGNRFNWNEKVRMVRAIRKDTMDINASLYDSLFLKNRRDVDLEEDIFKSNTQLAKYENKYEHLSPDLSIITPFESKLLNELSKLKILNSTEKVNEEFEKYSHYWNSKNLNHKDILKNYHLGFINKNYNNLKWRKEKPIDAENTELSDSKIINQINKASNEDLIDLFDKFDNYSVDCINPFNGKQSKLPEFESLHNVLPNDWMQFVIDSCMNEWIVVRLNNRNENKIT